MAEKGKKQDETSVVGDTPRTDEQGPALVDTRADMQWPTASEHRKRGLRVWPNSPENNPSFDADSARTNPEPALDEESVRRGGAA